VTISRRLWWVATGAWAALIFALSSIPTSTYASGVNLRDALLHATEYAVLAWLLRRCGLSWTMAFLLASAYGASDEFHQSFVPNRDASAMDWFFDIVGASVGATVGGLELGSAGTSEESLEA